MSLALKILSFKGKPLAQSVAVFIGDEGGTIGRSNNNTLVLTDPEHFVSRHHASIRVENGLYYLTDSSLSGVFIDEQTEALHNSSQQLFDGNLLKIGEYKIAVSITEETASDNFSLSYDETAAPLLPGNDLIANRLLSDGNCLFDKHDELMQTDENDFRPAFESKLQGNQSPLFDSYIAPPIAAKPRRIEEIPENFSFEDLLNDNLPASSSHAILDSEAGSEPLVTESSANALFQSFQETDEASNQPTPTPAATAATKIVKPASTPAASSPNLSSPHDLAFAAFLQGADINNLEYQPEQISETMQRTGQMFRKLIDGTIALLRSRAEFKSLFRANMTMIKTANNNPLKFSVSTDDVLRQLLKNKTGGFLESTAAIDESFGDIMNHQLAMQAGIQASLTDLLRSFDPKLIEKQFEQGLVLQKKSKCWDSFCKTYQDAVDNAVDEFFGDAFIQAYEAQMKALTADRHKNNAPK